MGRWAQWPSPLGYLGTPEIPRRAGSAWGTATRRWLRSSGWPARRPPTTINTHLSQARRDDKKEIVCHLAHCPLRMRPISCSMQPSIQRTPGPPTNGWYTGGRPPTCGRMTTASRATLSSLPFPSSRPARNLSLPPLRVSTLVTTGQKNAGTFFLFHLPVVGGFSGLI